MQAVLLYGLAGSSAPARAQDERAGVFRTVQGVVLTLEELRKRPEQPPLSRPREASPRRKFHTSAASPPQAVSAPEGRQSRESATPRLGNGPDFPQGLADKILGPQITDTAGFVPPDTMGAVGPTQFLFSVNGRFRAFNKNMPHTKIFDTDQVTFWGSTADPAGVSDAHVRYDPTTQRWFITEIDVPTGNNHLLLAVSSGPDLSTATWTQFAIPTTGSTVAQDSGCFADYDTPGIDQNAIYVGENMFGGVSPCTANYLHANLYVVQKSSALTSTLHVTTFYNVVAGTFGIETIQGVDSVDSLSTGYAVAVKDNEIPPAHLNLWQINNPGTTSPTLSGPTAIGINTENGSMGGVLSANNVASSDPTRPLDDIDDRLFSAVIRAGHLWTAHNVAVDSTGNSNPLSLGSLTRDAVRWYDVNVPGLTLNQSGTVFDGASSGFLHYWMGTVMVSGQGHVAMGLNRANSTTVVQAGALGRLSGDAPGTMQGFSLFQSSTADAYDDSSFVTNPANRWGDYTYTSLDPCDDMTMWTTQEYVAGPGPGVPIGWGVAAEKLQAPKPATPVSASPNKVLTGQPSVDVVITGTSSAGTGFYDTPSSITDPCRQRIGAAVTGGVTVNSVVYTDPTHVTLNLSTVSAAAGSPNVTITNPDGQMGTGSSILTVCPTISLSPSTLPAGSVGSAYTPTVLTPSAGTGPFTFTVTGLPAGMTPTSQVIGPSVTIGGTPTAIFSGMITVAGQDANGCTFSQNFSLSISCPPPPSTTITAPGTVCSLSVDNTASVPNAGAGATYAWTITNGTITSGQGTTSITFSAGVSGPISLGVTVTATPGCPATGGVSVTVDPACASFYTVTPCRIVDTRNANGPYGGPALVAGANRTFVFAGHCSIPATAKAVALNVTATNQTTGGSLTLYAGGTTQPIIPTIDYNVGKTRANNAIVSLGASGDITVFCGQGSGSVDMLIDVNGYFQ
jgi:hypothetical protein